MKKLFTIKKGNHYSNKWFPYLTFKSSVKFQIQFENSPNYEISSDKQKDTNKLFGISDGWHHHKHSIRIGWRIVNEMIEFMLYYYIDGKHYSHILYVSELEKSMNPFNGSIEIKKDCYIVNFNDIEYIVTRFSKWFGLRYLLFPYFGGTTVAPKDFKINIKWSHIDLEDYTIDRL